MRPVLFEIFNIKINTYGAMIALGIIAAVLLLSYRGKKLGYDEDQLLDMSIVAVISGLIGAKLLYLVTDIDDLSNNLSSWKDVIQGGLVVYGGIAGGALGVFIFCRRRKLDIYQMLDLVVPSVSLAQGFGRIGCFFAGCCYGKETSQFFGVKFNNSIYAPSGVKLIPTQLFSSGFDFLLAAFLLWYSRKERERGKVFALYIIIYSVGRFFVEFLRGDKYRGFVGDLSTSQFISIFTFLIGILLFFKANIFEAKKK